LVVIEGMNPPFCLIGVNIIQHRCLNVNKQLRRAIRNTLNPEFAVGNVARHLKSQRNAQLERFSDAGIIIIMLRNKIVS
jgi:hypothetical protein